MAPLTFCQLLHTAAHTTTVATSAVNLYFNCQFLTFLQVGTLNHADPKKEDS